MTQAELQPDPEQFAACNERLHSKRLCFAHSSSGSQLAQAGGNGGADLNKKVRKRVLMRAPFSTHAASTLSGHRFPSQTQTTGEHFRDTKGPVE